MKASEAKIAPVFKCEEDKHGYLSFWCPWCRVDHQHGTGEGHRCAHCSSGPFRSSGYILLAPGSKIPKRTMVDHAARVQEEHQNG